MWLAGLGGALALLGLGLVVAQLGAVTTKPSSRVGNTCAKPPCRPVHCTLPASNAWVRHPLYLGVLVLLAGAWLVAPTWPRAVFGLVTWAYVLLGLRLEERKLGALFGSAYRAYQQRVPALWPAWPWR